MDNLLKLKLIGPILRSPWLWRFLRIICLLLLVAMTAWGWHHHRIAGIDVRDPLMYTNLTNHLFWVWWIMGIVFIALLFGRSWCSVCPLGWLNGLVARFGFRWEMPSWLQNFIPVTLVLVLLQLMVYFLAIHRFPDYTAVLLALCLLLSIGVGLLFRQRAFCSLLCPAGAMFGLYARIAPFQLRVINQDVCAGCDSQRCIAEPVEWQQHRLSSLVLYRKRQLEGCPAGLVPAELNHSADCTLCLNCVQNCDKENVKVGFRPWLADLYASGLRPSETLFFLVLLGMLTANFSKVYVDLRLLVFWLPEQSARLLGWQENGYHVLAALWITLIFPLLMMLPGYLLLKLGEVSSSSLSGPPTGQTLPATVSTDEINEPDGGFWATLGRLALPFIPLILAAHAVLALVKINAKAAYLPFALGDSSGVKSYLAMNVMQTVSNPGVLMPLDMLKWLIALVLIAGLLFSCRVGYRLAVEQGDNVRSFMVASFAGVTLVFGLYMATVIEWLFVR